MGYMFKLGYLRNLFTASGSIIPGDGWELALVEKVLISEK